MTSESRSRNACDSETQPRRAAAFTVAAVVVVSTFLAATVTTAASENRPPAGTLRGRVVDAASRKILPYANVALYRVTDPVQYPDGSEAGGVLSQRDGSFMKSVEPGEYRIVVRYISYERAVLHHVVVKPGETTEVVAELQSQPITTKVVVVEGARVRDKEAALLAARKNAETIGDAISSEQISRSADSNAADALQRVTGVSVVEGKYVFVRGLGERYSSTQINGASVGTPEPNKRVVPLDLFPSGALDNIQIQKTYSPDMEGEFGGGVVSVQTREFQDKRLVNQGISLGLETGGPGGFLTYRGGSWDFLGFDDGTRRLPAAVQELAGNRTVVGGPSGLPQNDLRAIARSFENVWTPYDGGSRPSFGYSGVLSQPFTVFGRKAGFLATASLSNKYETLEREDNVYEGSVVLTPRSQARVVESTAGVLAGLTGNFSVDLGKDRRLKLSAVYTRQTDDKAAISEGPNYDYGTDLLRVTRLAYVERGLLSLVGAGERPMGGEGSKLDWTLSYSEATRSEPDRRETFYEQDAAGVMRVSSRFTYPFLRIFGDSREYDRAFKVNWLIPVTRAQALASGFKTGFAFRFRNRNSGYRRFGYTCRGGNCLDRTLAPEVLLSDTNLAEGHYKIEETTRQNDSYDAYQMISAWYGMADLKLVERVRLVAGARIEQSEQRVDTRSPFVTGKNPDVEVELADTDVLPAANVTWNVTGKLNVRAGYSETLARPELRELSPFSMYNYETSYLEQGNPKLQTARLKNWDLRWELFPGRQELVAVSIFRKDFDQPIEKYVEPDVANYRLLPLNGLDGELLGTEVEIRATLARAWTTVVRPFRRTPAPAGLERWGVGFNWSRVESEVRLPVSGRIATTPLNGQSSHTTNVGLFYSSPRLDGSLMYQEFGARLATFGLGVLPDVYEYPLRGLDLTLGWNVNQSFRLKLFAENLLDESEELRQGEMLVQRWSPGRRLGLTMAYKN